MKSQTFRVSRAVLALAFLVAMSVMLAWPQAGKASVTAGQSGGQGVTPGTASGGKVVQGAAPEAISPVASETGLISWSIDGLGTNSSTGTIEVQKPAGATVRKAYMAAASTGFTGYVIANGDISVNGTPVNWSMTVPSAINSSNVWADITSIVTPIVDPAPAGRVPLTITENNTFLIDGEQIVVIFDDPAQTTNNTIALLFGAQNTTGDNFNLLLGSPWQSSFGINMSLGISYSYQTGGTQQFSTIDVNTLRMTTSAGGQDDADIANSGNGALYTVGGLDDSTTNPPDPNAPPTNPRSDDELYDLAPFINVGDTAIHVHTQNPSNDDNILFAGFFISGASAIVGEGAVLSPQSATNPVGTSHTVTATLQFDNGNPIVGRAVDFAVISGPNTGVTGSGVTNAQGQATFTYSSSVAGTDTLQASFLNSHGQTQTSNTVTKTWVSTPTVTPTITPTPGGACSVCNAYISDLNISCNPNNTVHWSAVVRNNDECTVTTPMTAQLQVQRNYGAWHTVLTNTFTASFPPDLTMFSGDFGPYSYPSNTTGIRVYLAFTSTQRGCNSIRKSPSIDPCGVSAGQ